MTRPFILMLCLFAALQSASLAQDAQNTTPALKARVIAVGIPGASAVASVGFFHPGGPIHDKPEFAAFTQPGRILDRQRILVASNSNFGAPRAQMDSAEGAVLSFDPDGPTIVVEPNFATAGGQASRLDGRVQLFAAQSPPFLNSVRNPGAASATHPSVSNPNGISINNAFGRLWLSDDKVFRLRDNRTFTPPELDNPIDLAAVVPEVANPGFASNTTMAGNSDMYIVNRGNGTIVRMRQDGTVVAVRRVALPNGQEIGPGRLNGIAVSPDGQKIWLTVSGSLPDYPDRPGAVLEIPAFGPGRAAVYDRGKSIAFAPLVESIDIVERGARLFQAEFTPSEGLGPLYNARSCLECHRSPTVGGMGLNGLATVHRVGRFDRGAFDSLVGLGGPVARKSSVAELGKPCNLLATGPPPAANLISVRNAAPLYGLGLIDTIPDKLIEAGAVANGAVKGRPNYVHDSEGRERVGRLGWKADIATLAHFVAEAFRNELGITNPLAPTDLFPRDFNCVMASAQFDDDGTFVAAVTAYIAALPAPAPIVGAQHQAGEKLFVAVGCAACHTPVFSVDGLAVRLFSDLLLHDLGPALDDGVIQGGAKGKDWRTTPLWGLGSRGRFLHDGRAETIADAVLAHDGEAAVATKAFRELTSDEKNTLLTFLSAL